MLDQIWVSHFVTSMTAPVASGWSGCRVEHRTHWKAPPCHGAYVERPLRIATVDGSVGGLRLFLTIKKQNQLIKSGRPDYSP
ncbi:MAG: hypothetical protein WCB94_17565, partial [Terriglobales bacterium]